MIRNSQQVNVATEPGCHLIRMELCWGRRGGGGSVCYFEEEKSRRLEFNGMALRRLDLFLGNVSFRDWHLNNVRSMKIISWLEKCFQVFQSKERRLAFPSLVCIFALRYTRCFVWAEQAGRWAHLFASFYYIFGDGAVTTEVMTWVSHLGNHFHIPEKRAIMIAFDNWQSKLHHPPRVLVYAILWRRRKIGGGVGVRVVDDRVRVIKRDGRVRFPFTSKQTLRNLLKRHKIKTWIRHFFINWFNPIEGGSMAYNACCCNSIKIPLSYQETKQTQPQEENWEVF